MKNGLRVSLCLALTGTLSAGPALAAPAPVAAAPAAASEGRHVTDLTHGWRFRFGDAGDAAATPGFDDSGWETVSVPHSWNVIGEYSLTRSAKTNNKQGIGWYRTTVTAPAAAPGQRQYLDFEAVSKIADVWVNGVHIGQHRGAFSRFRLDVTKVWKPSAANLVAVRADNTKPAVGNTSAEVIPLSGDFFVHGGIYRPVSLVTTDGAGIDLLDLGGPGVYARATTITADKADVAILTRLRNSGAAARRLTVATRITDASGKIVAQGSQPLVLKPGAAEAKASLAITTPHLWNGRADPYLYTVTAEVRDSDGKGGTRIIDRVTQPLGLRNFRFDANDGFFLNGKHLPLHGVSRHQDRLGQGWALSDANHAEDMALIAEMGANTVRQAHYQHADAWTTEADKAGMVVWAEVPYITSPTLEGGVGSPVLWANAEQQARELVRQNYNHPSILMWSVGNEVDSAKGFGVGGKAMPKPLALLQKINAVVKEEDPFRPTTFADCCEDLGMMATAGEKLAGTADLIGYNRYYGWYYPQPLKMAEQLGKEMDKFHAKHPTLPISISEYGAGGAISQHSDDVKTGFLNFIGRPHPEDYESWLHEQTWPVIRARPFIFASWVWAMFDFASDFRDEGDAVDLNDKGLVTADRKTRKDAFYYYKAQWSGQPMLHLTAKRHVDRAYPVIAVKAYSTADKASLTLNGAPLGEVACPDHICLWPAVTLRPGANIAVVNASVGGQQLSDSATWTGPDSQAGLRIDVGNLGSSRIGGKLYGSDSFVTGGTPMILNLVGMGGRRMMPERIIDAAQPDLYAYWREGPAFSYAIPLPNGRWTVTLHSFEPRTDSTVDGTMMTVTANGKVALPAFNVRKVAGAPLKGLTRSFPVMVKDGVLKLDVSATGGKAVVAALEISR
ncbi:beta galactosidase jelly roll domain-containing protein [Sphingobium sufflavum]|uniref:glycoside hydrolase family 2 TIM barrel-domain containing protein n=1 Tax=Sphingobium sufflavum TaxID=1129547 RepID=UPI001F33EB08|nr:glycoside hydrolase family 2 TIM barrel-domain containing protein [Sphingobium sufflavum]MCE7796337.1 beta galactosidase jelly roll domain-containing protein [Sphingobium sufflavum]